HEVEAAAAHQRIETALAVGADLRLERCHAARREEAAQQLAVGVVERRVLEDEQAGRRLVAAADHLEQRAPGRAEGAPVRQPRLDVREAGQRPEVVLLVAVERRLLAHAPPDRMRIGVDREVVGVVVDLAARHRRLSVSVWSDDHVSWTRIRGGCLPGRLEAESRGRKGLGWAATAPSGLRWLTRALEESYGRSMLRHRRSGV